MRENKYVNFDLLLALMNEAPNHTLEEVLTFLDMCEVELSPAVRKLGEIRGLYYTAEELAAME